MLAQARAVFVELELFTAGLAANDVVVIARFFANEINGFSLFLVSLSSHNGTLLL